ncbi:hypothetical protein ACOMHN_047041 [Nucella lapillus]
MLRSFTKTMSVLIILPLLLAYRHPTYARPRASVLRRMPMFYGKRDPALASPPATSFSSSLPVPSRLESIKAVPIQNVPEEFVVNYLHRSSQPRARPGKRGKGVEGRSDNWGSGGSVGGGRGVGRLTPPWMAPGLLARLHDRLNSAGDLSPSNGQHPHFFESRLRRQFRQSPGDGGSRKPTSSESGERLRKKVKNLYAALGRGLVAHEGLAAVDEDVSFLIPVEASKAGDDNGHGGDVYREVWFDNTGDAGDGREHYKDGDGDFLVEVLDPDKAEKW